MKQHKEILNPLFKGKNIDFVMKNTSVRYKLSDKWLSRKGVLSQFAIGPNKKSKGKVNHSVIDRDLITIIATSHRTLSYLNISNCPLISKKTFEEIKNLQNLKKLSINMNEYFPL